MEKVGAAHRWRMGPSARGWITAAGSGGENVAAAVKGTAHTTHVEPLDDWRGAFARGSRQPSTHHTAPKPTTRRTKIATTRRMRYSSTCAKSLDLPVSPRKRRIKS